MELAKIVNGEAVEYPVSRVDCEAAIIAMMPATVTVEETRMVTFEEIVDVEGEDGTVTQETITREVAQTVEVEIESQREFPLPDNLAGLDLSAHGFAVVEPTDPPEVEPGEVAERDGIEPVDGVWRWKWSVRPGNADDLAQAKADALNNLRDLRWQKSVGGTTFNGIPIRTDEGSQAKIDGAVALFDKDPALTTLDFEAQPGVWVTFDKAAMEAIGVAVGRHVQACFSRQRELSGLIDAAETFADLAAVNVETGWPS